MLAEHLDKRINSKDVEMKAVRDGYGEGLLELGRNSEHIVALCCDLTESTRTSLFADAFPDRFIQIGIAEQNLVSVASGMAAMGKIPFATSYAMFSPGRSWEQIRTTIAYNNANVKIIGAHAGVSVGPDGATHQAIEDIAIMRALPNMVVIAPADSIEARKATMAAAEYEGPVYIRLAREKTPIVTTDESPFSIGKAYTVLHKDVKHQKTVGIVVTGTLLHHSITAATELNNEGIGVSVLHMPTVKPLDTNALMTFAAEHDFLVTVEEHQITGGLGGAVCEFMSENYPIKILRVGVNDEFGQSGEPDELIAHYGMDSTAIINKIKSHLG